MNRYQRLRGDNQETYYNIGRMFHQMNILPLAMYFYEKCLKVVLNHSSNVLRCLKLSEIKLLIGLEI